MYPSLDGVGLRPEPLWETTSFARLGRSRPAPRSLPAAQSPAAEAVPRYPGARDRLELALFVLVMVSIAVLEVALLAQLG